MSSLLFGAVSSGYIPPDENIVRMTTAPVQPDAPAAVADNAPDPQEVETDPNPNLGMATRQVASQWVQGDKYPPPWIPQVDGNHNHNDVIDRQVSSSGTAAAREAAGSFGHGTMSYAYGIEPAGGMAEGQQFGNEYFQRHEREVQATAVDSMTLPPGIDQDTTNRVAAVGKANARAAHNAAYQAWYDNR